MKRLFMVDVVKGLAYPVKGECRCGFYVLGTWTCRSCQDTGINENRSRVSVSRRRLRQLKKAAEECDELRSEKAVAMAALASAGLDPAAPLAEQIQGLLDRLAKETQARREAQRSRP